MAGDSDPMNAAPSSATPTQRRSRSRVFGVLTACIAVVLAGASVAGYALAVTAPESMGFALTTTVLTLLAGVLAVLAFQSAQRYPDTLPLSGPLRLLAVLSIVVATAGAAITIVIGVAHGSVPAVVLALVAFVAGLVLFALAAALYRFVIPGRSVD
ncbi:hypothetical protein ET475_03450 [Microbacterium protaetiae]|uniref:Uncharacterized protein n=1 Tax=Microbacterium protaetiae TaxID=2509458 RepID=A0A4P6EDJ4_9MICO|nr:hypothetical protein [Microbacterium protaetiae]QAY59139.1 hypothetical protein ET475_03450 [Microbacterium protaetiae]